MTIAIKDVAHIRFSAPDLELAHRFLHDFGFIVSAEENGATYYRVSGAAHHAYVLTEGEPKFLGFAMSVDSRADLEELARSGSGGELEAIDEPGGGERVRLVDPDGHNIEIVHGIDLVDPLPMREPTLLNYAYEKRRLGEAVRPPKEPAQMKRLGHVGITVSSIPKTIEWYGERFSMVPSDTVEAGPEHETVMGFVRSGFPGVYSDHHALALFAGEPAFGHAAFETQDFDAVAAGHEYLMEQGWESAWGIGRHELGSQIFDYWNDPWGHWLEHFADSDQFLPEKEHEVHIAGESRPAWWGPQGPHGPQFSGAEESH